MIAKVGDKFVVEVEEIYTSKNGLLYRMKGFNSLVFDDTGISKLVRLHDINDYDAPKFSVGDEVKIIDQYYGASKRAVIIEADSRCITVLCNDGTTDVIYEEDYSFITKTGNRFDAVTRLLSEMNNKADGSE